MTIMAAATTVQGGPRTVVIGLALEDIKKLISGIPIHGDLEKITGIPGMKILVFSGGTDEQMKDAMFKAIGRTTTLPKEATAADVDAFLGSNKV